MLFSNIVIYIYTYKKQFIYFYVVLIYCNLKIQKKKFIETYDFLFRLFKKKKKYKNNKIK